MLTANSPNLSIMRMIVHGKKTALAAISALLILAAGCRSHKLARESLPQTDSLLFYHHQPVTEKKSEVKGRRERFVVNSIEIIVYPPLGRDISDTSKRDNNVLKKLVNKTHINTRPYTVKQLLLFKDHDTITRLHITESERLLRRNLKIRDARVIAKPSASNPKAYDVTVLVQDQISYNVGISDLNNITSYTLSDRNILGLGSTFEGGLAFSNNQYQYYSLYYNDPSVYNSYIDLSLSYSNADSNFTNGARINKNFSSGLFTWAGGGGYIYKNADRYFYTGTDISGGYNSVMRQADAWVGKSFRLNFNEAKNAKNNSTKDFIIAARYINTYESTANITLPADSQFTIANKTSDKLLLTYGLSFRRYYKDSYIFRFKYSEDIPEGFLFSILLGKSFNKYYNDNYYTGFSAGLANNNRWGYWNFTFQYVKSFSQFSYFNNTVNSSKLLYLSPLLLKHRFKDRILFTAKAKKIGNDIAFDRLALSNDDGFLNVDSKVLSGLTKTNFIINNIIYTPYKPLGFNIGFFTYAAFANLSPVKDIVISQKWYQAYGVGVLLRNENLLINSIRISFTFYPSFPKTAFKFNPLWIYDLQIPDMSINQPEYELY